MNEMRECLLGNTGPVLFLVIFAEQIGLPLPAAPVLVAAGALVADGTFSPTSAIAVSVVACMIADSVWFYAGWRGGNGFLRALWARFHGDRSSLERTERLFARYGMSAVAAAKFVPWVGVLIPPLAGAFKVGVRKFLWFDVLGSLLYALVYLGLGFVFSNEVNAALELFSGFGVWAAILTAALVLIVLAHKHTRKGEQQCLH